MNAPNSEKVKIYIYEFFLQKATEEVKEIFVLQSLERENEYDAEFAKIMEEIKKLRESNDQVKKFEKNVKCFTLFDPFNPQFWYLIIIDIYMYVLIYNC